MKNTEDFQIEITEIMKQIENLNLPYKFDNDSLAMAFHILAKRFKEIHHKEIKITDENH